MFALYVHWPFCLKKCPYCDFNSHVSDAVDQGQWANALLSELSHYGSETKNQKLTSVFFGGGTPSLMEADTVERILSKASDYWCLDDNLEVTLEANPTSSEQKKFRDYKAAGVNRLSLGVQSFDDRVLSYLGREHSSTEAQQAIAMAGDLFDRRSFDLIYATPDQSRTHWQGQLQQALDLAGDHLSLYQLTIESGTAFFRTGEKAADEEGAADLYEDTQVLLEDAGMPAYEISNHARPGQECRHNLVYWQGGDYVGIGPGAHGRLQVDGKTVATHQIHNPDIWLKNVTDKGHGTAKRRTLDGAARAEELLILGLRLSAGINFREIAARTGVSVMEHINPQNLEMMRVGGFLQQTESHLVASAEGRQRLNTIIAKLVEPS